MADIIPGLAGDVVGAGDSRPIPSDVAERVSAIRDAHLEALEDAAAAMDAEIGRAAADAIAKIKASGYSPAVIRRAADAMVGKSSDIARRVLAEQIQDAALYADRADEVMRAWEIRERLGGQAAAPAERETLERDLHRRLELIRSLARWEQAADRSYGRQWETLAALCASEPELAAALPDVELALAQRGLETIARAAARDLGLALDGGVDGC